jgi:hypothetical protein
MPEAQGVAGEERGLIDIVRKMLMQNINALESEKNARAFFYFSGEI